MRTARLNLCLLPGALVACVARGWESASCFRVSAVFSREPRFPIANEQKWSIFGWCPYDAQTKCRRLLIIYIFKITILGQKHPRTYECLQEYCLIDNICMYVYSYKLIGFSSCGFFYNASPETPKFTPAIRLCRSNIWEWFHSYVRCGVWWFPKNDDDEVDD